MDIDDKKRKLRRMRMEALCRETGLSRSTIYQYLRSGILHPSIKEGPTQVRYDETHLKQLEKIRHLRKDQKLSIPEIQEMFQVKTPQKVDTSGASNHLKNLIFDKALEFFSKNGFAKTKITDLTDALQLGKGTFYLYFKSKEELFLECIGRFPRIILSPHNWEEIRKERNYFRRTHKRLQFMLKAFPTFMGIISIAKLALRGDAPSMAKKATECFQTINHPLSKEMKRAIQDGLIREVDHEFISFVLFGMGEAAGYWRMMTPNYSPEKCINELMDFISHGLIARDANAAGKLNKKGFNGEVEDFNRIKIQLRGIRFNKETHIEGKLGGGKLQIDIEKIGSIKVKKEEPEHIALVTMKTGELITIQIDGSITLSGESPFGKYLIPIAKVIRIVMEPVCENAKPTSPAPA
ncbi:MAG: TetR family transcriptional regulator [Dissulfuribacterales bacterium]